MEVQNIRIDLISPSPLNPRKTFDEAALEELASNIEKQGLLQPITVRVAKSEEMTNLETGDVTPLPYTYEIVCGERRFRAVSLLKAKEDEANVAKIKAHRKKSEKFQTIIRAAMPDVFSTAEKWRYCDNYWVLPSDKTIVEPVYGNIPLFGIAQTEDIIRSYRLEYGWNGSLEIPPYQIWHDRDGSAEFYSGAMFLKSKSRLASQNKPMSNLIAVYEARNVIYVKRGGLGFIVSKKTDATGSIALTDDEKEQLLKQNFEKYGVRKGQVPYGISDADIDFVRTNLSIAELQPFEETLADAINIAGAYGIPAVLVPRKDQSTFSNQATAEKSVYCSTVIPMAKQFCKDFTAFLGLEGGGYYLDCDFSDVDCLQEGLKESEDVKTNINKRCREQFSCGLITLNDWRAQIGESMIENPLFDKLKFDMSDEELDKVNRVFNTKSGDEKDGRENQKPSVQDKGK